MSVNARELYDEQLELAKAWYPILKAQSSLHEFVRQAWPILEPQTPFVDGWHIAAICEHLEAVTAGKIQTLIINVPPRTMKSTLVSVMWPAWWFINEPSHRFLCASHSHSLAARDSIACRTVIESDWYQRNWGHHFRLEKNTEHKFTTDKMGYRQITSVDSRATGMGGDTLIADDLNDTEDVFSDIKREKTNRWFSVAFSGRMNDRKRGSMVITMQRCNEMDVTGYVISGDKQNQAVKLILPMEYESNRKCKTIVLPSTNGKVWEDPRKLDGELLWPQKDGPAEVQAKKDQLRTAYNIAGQLQQRPSPEDGGIISKKHFKIWKKEKSPELELIIQSWDTALEADEMNDFSACTTWGLFKDENNIDNLILLSLWRGRVEYPDLRKMAIRLHNDFRNTGDRAFDNGSVAHPDLILIESRVSGHSLIHDLQKVGIMCSGFNPKVHGDKIARVKKAALLIEGGRIWLPSKPGFSEELTPYAQTLLEMCIMFPNGDSRDVVDTMSQVLLRLRSTGYLGYPGEQRTQERIRPKHGFYSPSLIE